MQKNKNKTKQNPQITEKIHQWVLSLKWSNDYLKTSSAMTLFLVKNPMGTFGEHFKFLESLRRDGIFKAKDNFWIKFWKFWFLKKKKKKSNWRTSLSPKVMYSLSSIGGGGPPEASGSHCCGSVSLQRRLLLALPVTWRTCPFLVNLHRAILLSFFIGSWFTPWATDSSSQGNVSSVGPGKLHSMWWVAASLGQPQLGYLGQWTSLGIK